MAYQARLIKSNALHFDDIIIVTLRLLRQNNGELAAVVVIRC